MQTFDVFLVEDVQTFDVVFLVEDVQTFDVVFLVESSWVSSWVASEALERMGEDRKKLAVFLVVASEASVASVVSVAGRELVASIFGSVV